MDQSPNNYGGTPEFGTAPVIEQKSKKPIAVVIIAIVIVLILAAGLATFFILNKKSEDQSGVTEPTPATPVEPVEDKVFTAEMGLESFKNTYLSEAILTGDEIFSVSELDMIMTAVINLESKQIPFCSDFDNAPLVSYETLNSKMRAHIDTTTTIDADFLRNNLQAVENESDMYNLEQLAILVGDDGVKISGPCDGSMPKSVTSELVYNVVDLLNVTNIDPFDVEAEALASGYGHYELTVQIAFPVYRCLEGIDHGGGDHGGGVSRCDVAVDLYKDPTHNELVETTTDSDEITPADWTAYEPYRIYLDVVNYEARVIGFERVMTVE